MVMELEELKKEWETLNMRINQMEILNRKIIEGIMTQKARASQEKVMNTERKLMILCFVFAVVYGLLYFLAYPEISKYGLSNAFWLFEIVMITAGMWQGYKMWLLKQMDIEKCTPSELVERSIRFKVITKTRFIAGIIIIVPVMGLFIYFMKHLFTPAMIWVTCISAVAGLIIGLVIEMKHFRNINSLIRSLKEVRESIK